MDSLPPPRKDFDVAREKSALRAEMRRRLAGLSPAARSAASRVILARFLAHPLMEGARSVALFAAMETEPDLAGIIAGRPDLRICLPRVAGDRLEFHEARGLGGLVPGYRGILEPPDDPGTRVPVAELDRIVVPGLAFDAAGGRLGRGAGFYDRTLPAIRPGCRVIGVCFAMQLVARVPREPHDRGMAAVVSG